MHKWLFPRQKPGEPPAGQLPYLITSLLLSLLLLLLFPCSLLCLLYANLAAAFLNSSTLSVCSQVRSKSVRPKWP